METSYDVIVIGAGIVGLATARRILADHPSAKVLVLEKEADIAMHQTGHNSGVIHSGIYYKPGSAKAKLCAEGRLALLDFAKKHAIPYELCGKIVVATKEDELPRLEELYKRGTANKVPRLEMIGPQRLREIEPHARGIRALYSPEAGIIDFTQVAKALAQELRAAGGEIRTGQAVRAIHEGADEVIVSTSGAEFRAKQIVNCAGLFSDSLSGLADVRIIPFRGEYYRLAPASAKLVRALIYPVPDPRFPFLGVHFTRNIRGYVEAGPNAVLAFAREGYKKSTIDLRELFGIFAYSGFHVMAKKFWKTGLAEFRRSFSKKLFTKALQALVPEIQESDLVAGGAGVRAQAVGSDGTLFDDFVIRQTQRAIHVINAPSPAATASLAIAGHIAGLYQHGTH